eukprot:3532205-Lingulodinium_polyedra.AAC.1
MCTCSSTPRVLAIPGSVPHHLHAGHVDSWKREGRRRRGGEKRRHLQVRACPSPHFRACWPTRG